MKPLRRLAERAGVKESLLPQVGRLCGGRHPAQKELDRARNNLGFHWDAPVFQKYLREFERNKTLVWLEGDEDNHYVFSLASEVVVQAMLPEMVVDQEISRRRVDEALRRVTSATRLLQEFFTAATFGFMLSHGFTQQKRSPVAYEGQNKTPDQT
jgi:hypothetical protein